MMSTPVTREQFALFDPHHERKYHAELARYSPALDCPAIYVTWYDAWCFARWLGANYRLPTEAEWEYACRAGKGGKWYCGDDEKTLNEYAWYGEDWDKGATHPVATKRPNDWGLHDMHGNVWEWCADWFDEDYYAKSPMEDPPGPNIGSLRVYRGGSGDFSARYCRSAYRRWNAPGTGSTPWAFAWP
jgi:formylglycine-generating enzyme required for sulfatase activity